MTLRAERCDRGTVSAPLLAERGATSSDELCGCQINNLVLYPLSYSPIAEGLMGFEPTTSRSLTRLRNGLSGTSPAFGVRVSETTTDIERRRP